MNYNLMTSVPGLFAAGEANFSDHGANRLGASALMQGLADGYFVLPYTIGDYLADDIRTGAISTFSEFEEADKVKNTIDSLINNDGDTPVDDFHRRLGLIMWNKCGMSRNETDLKEAITEIQALREEFYQKVGVPGSANEFNPELAKGAARVADFLELGECGRIDSFRVLWKSFREESQTEEGEALRDDENFTFVSAWEFTGKPSEANLHKEELEYKNIELKQRSYK